MQAFYEETNVVCVNNIMDRLKDLFLRKGWTIPVNIYIPEEKIVVGIISGIKDLTKKEYTFEYMISKSSDRIIEEIFKDFVEIKTRLENISKAEKLTEKTKKGLK